MIIAVQWTLNTPTDWQDIDITPTGAGSRRWTNAPSKPEPTAEAAIDNSPGWVFDLCVQGVHFFGFDHYAVQPLSNGGVKVSVWNDDMEDDETDYRWGEVWELHPAAPDPRFGGEVNTRQKKTIYTEGPMSDFNAQETSMGPVEILPWSQFVMPPQNTIRHGVWVRDEALFNQHRQRQRARDWREWA